MGALLVTYLGDKIGRKNCHNRGSDMSNWINLVFGVVVVGHVTPGVSVGLASAIVLVYQSEITAAAIRGRIVSVQQ